MKMYLFELKSLRKSTIIWTFSIVALSAIFLSVYPSMVNDTAQLKTLLGGYPPAVRAALSINLDYITSFLGFYAMIFSFIVLIGAMQAMIIGTSILTKESRERTADFLLTKPVSRNSIVTSKLLAAVTMLFATDIVFYAVSILIANASGAADYNMNLFFMINVMLPFIQLLFLAIGVCVSVFFSKLKTVLPLSLGTVFGFYFIGAVIASAGGEEWTRYITPFKYYDVFYIIQHGSYEASYLIVGAILFVAAIALSYVVYNRKDIHAVS